MAEGARLESVCTVIPYRGFESRLLRQNTTQKSLILYMDGAFLHQSAVLQQPGNDPVTPNLEQYTIKFSLKKTQKP